MCKCGMSSYGSYHRRRRNGRRRGHFENDRRRNDTSASKKAKKPTDRDSGFQRFCRVACDIFSLTEKIDALDLPRATYLATISRLAYLLKLSSKQETKQSSCGRLQPSLVPLRPAPVTRPRRPNHKRIRSWSLRRRTKKHLHRRVNNNKESDYSNSQSKHKRNHKSTTRKTVFLWSPRLVLERMFQKEKKIDLGNVSNEQRRRHPLKRKSVVMTTSSFPSKTKRNYHPTVLRKTRACI